MAIYTKSCSNEKTDQKFTVSIRAYKQKGKIESYVVFTFIFPERRSVTEFELTFCQPEGTTSKDILAALRKALKEINWKD